MILSVIIVNYRVRYFLELCLHSVQKALQSLDTEVFVVDNNSGDGSVEYLRPLFPDIRFIVNTENTGFSRANNQALQLASGKYILFLNPDTILPEDIASRCLAFLQSTPDAGGLGVRMVDGSGLFLKESRRGFPSPWVAFCKLSGLTALFPGRRLFSTYYLGHLPPDRTSPAPVLSGACFWVAKAILEKTGGFDERFFMYAEDIDLSYRIEQAGYVNYYLAETTIVHFKGESTLKDIRYVKQFYKAMSQFRQKHFNRGLPALLNAGIELAIWLRAGIGALFRSLSRDRFFSGSRSLTRARSHAPSRSYSPAPSQGSKAPAPLKTRLMGDPATIRQLGEFLTATGSRVVTDDSHQAEELILCEGAKFSFKDCIGSLEELAPYRTGVRIKFYAEGSGSVVGSANRDGRGEIIEAVPHH
ncbi:MAG TPA: glycosyltransferase family 2 protein [Puia sp.]|jgi:GT2 family glycosyltransferase|nr:glycosyltransferase family 2 protein [Puia sp.]